MSYSPEADGMKLVPQVNVSVVNKSKSIGTEVPKKVPALEISTFNLAPVWTRFPKFSVVPEK